MKKYQANKKKSKNAGFSLLEVILSMAILAIISIPLLMYFAESIRYSALMEEEQKATMLAQEITEDLKVQDNLIAIPTGETAYSVPYLKDAGYTEMVNALAADGTGNITLSGTDGNYDVEVMLSTATAANAVIRPIIYGIDDTTDVLAVEREQKNQAVAYFMAVNNAYYASNPSAVLMTQSQVESNLLRKVVINIDQSGAEYTVCIYYEYTCTNLRGAGSVDTWATTNLLDVRMAELKNIYLLFDRNGTAGATDVIEVNSTATFPLGQEPELYFVCQNLTLGEDAAYRLQVKRPVGAGTSWSIHTNVGRPVVEGGVTLVNQTGAIIDEYGNSIDDTKELTGSGTPVRIIAIETKIYKKGHTASDEPYAVINTTKGE